MNLVITPRLTEKSYATADSLNTYVFNVPLTTNKIEVKKAVEALYGVSVVNVTILTTKGKVKRTVRKGGRQISGSRKDTKKAYVRLAKDQSIPIFAQAAEENNEGGAK